MTFENDYLSQSWFNQSMSEWTIFFLQLLINKILDSIQSFAIEDTKKEIKIY